MNQAARHWERHLPDGKYGAHFFPEFETRAKAVSAEILRVKTPAEARDALLDLMRSLEAKKAVAVRCPLQEKAGIPEALKSAGIQLFTERADIAEHAATADVGISGVEFAVAETGSVCQNATAIEDRLVSMLPPVHVAFLDSNRVIPGIEDAFEIFSKIFDRGYISFITGPSRTADIERVLTIGVHGPSRLILIAVDEVDAGGR